MTQTNGQLKTGSYAVTTVYTMPWAKKVSTPIKTKRLKTEKKIAHEIFEQCSELTKDEYWIAILKNCARDKFPRGFQYKNGLLMHRRGNKTVRVEIPSIPSEAYSLAVNFFRNNAGLMSTSDRKRVQKEYEARLLEETSKNEVQWKDIRVERVKELLITEFIYELAQKSNFNNEQKKELSTTVKRGFMLKYFASKNIKMEHGKIVSIEGLLYNQDTNQFYIDSKLLSKNSGRKFEGLGLERSDVKSKITPLTLWVKYLENQEKKLNNKNGIQVIDDELSESGNYSCDYSSPIDTDPADIYHTASPTGDSL